MVLEARKTSIVYNGVSVPGIDRNGSFLAESPVETFILYRTGTTTTAGTKPFTIEFPSVPKTAVILDTNSNSSYTFEVTTREGILWSYTFSGIWVYSYGNTKTMNFPIMVIDKDSRVVFKPSVTIQAMALFTNLAYNVDVREI